MQQQYTKSYLTIPREIFLSEKISSTCKLLYSYLLSIYNINNDITMGNLRLSIELDVNERTIQRALLELQEAKFITITHANTDQIKTNRIINPLILVHTKNSGGDKNVMGEGAGVTKMSPNITNTPILTNSRISNKRSTSDDKYVTLAKLLFTLMLKNFSRTKEPNFKEWEKQIRLTETVDGFTCNEIREVIIWSQNNSFWKKNIRSASKLRKQMTQLMMNIEEEKSRKTNLQSNNRRNFKKPEPPIQGFYTKYEDN